MSPPARPALPEPRARGLLVAVGTLAGLLLLEAGLRASGALSPPLARALREWDPRQPQIELLGENCYRPRPGATFHYADGAVAHINASGYRGPEVQVPKPAGVFRIVLLGGSTTLGFGVDDHQTIDATLRARLAVEHPGRRFEAVNLGCSGYDSGCDLERLKADGLELAPDALILHSGINDVPRLRSDGDGPPAPHAFDAALERLRDERRFGRPSLWSRVKQASFAARAPGLLLYALRGNRLAVLDGAATPSAAEVERFAANLRQTVALAGKGTLLLFSTPPSALGLPTPPVARCRGYIVVDDATTQRYRDALDQRLRRLAQELAAGGAAATYVAHHVPPEHFLDDCHLDAEGNRRVAEDFVAALAPFLSSASPD